ncbi:YARHG domain-containing protein [Mediterraneibacter glycyrrhizinilyticus]|nr:YARHG domain-containing protein [Mediterraneibacter glycyrrhizinilyticus]MBM6855188.1 YARHG domain-containing protein [Mediterraneibacter glycyrrhizinilyticus]
MGENSTKNAIWKCACALLGLFIVLVLAGTALLFFWPAGGIGQGAGKTASKTELQAVAPAEDEMQTKSSIQIGASGEVTSAAETEDAELSADYVIPDSNTKLLADADIEGLSAQQLNYARNEIYARHGRMFDSDELQKYFESKSWYKAQYTADEFDQQSDSVLTDTEKKNAEFLREAENNIQPGGYQLDQ